MQTVYSLALAKGLSLVVHTYCSMKLLKEFWSIDNEQSRELYLLKVVTWELILLFVFQSHSSTVND